MTFTSLSHLKLVLIRSDLRHDSDRKTALGNPPQMLHMILYVLLCGF